MSGDGVVVGGWGGGQWGRGARGGGRKDVERGDPGKLGQGA